MAVPTQDDNTEAYLYRVLHVARQAAAAAGSVLRHRFGNARITEKQSHNLVTEADLEAESRITDIIQSVYPQHNLLREETGATSQGDSEHLWVIDPLDGTNNYAHGMPHFSVSIAYTRAGIPQVALVFDPLRDEWFTAIRGVGAWLNDGPIHVSTRPTIPQSLITTGFYYDRGEAMERTLEAIRTLFKSNVRGIRRTGGAALDLAYVACGRFEGFFEYRLAPWDYAAGSLLVEQAGGKCACRAGHPLQLDSLSVVAANSLVFAEFLALVRWIDV